MTGQAYPSAMITFLLLLFIIGLPLAFILVGIGAVMFGWQVGTRGLPVEVKRGPRA